MTPDEQDSIRSILIELHKIGSSLEEVLNVIEDITSDGQVEEVKQD